MRFAWVSNRWRGVLLAASVIAGCVSPVSQRDLRPVGELAGVELDALSRVVTDDFQLDAERAISSLLEAPLGAEEAVRVALLGNRELRARLLELGVARGRLIGARAVANPHVEVEVLPERNTDIELALEYEITSLVLAPLRARAARADLDAARIEAAAEVVGLGQRVRVAFFDLQAAHQRLAIAQRALDAFAAGHEAAQAMLEAGNVTPLEAAARTAAYERARILVAEGELELADRRERVHPLLGLHGRDLEWRAVEELPPVAEEPPREDELEARAIAANLDLAARRSRLDAAQRRLELARVDGWMPRIEVDVHALYSRPDTALADSPWGVGGGVNVEVPLFDRGRGSIVSRRAELAAIEQRRDGLGIDVRSATRRIWNRLSSAHARAVRYQQVILPAQREVTEQTVLQYNAMQVGIFGVLQARRDEFELELDYVESLRQYWNARATLDALLAGRAMELMDDGPAPTGSGNEAEEGGH